MTPEQLKAVKSGDVLVCTHGNFHFEVGSEYTITPHPMAPEFLRIVCDEDNNHFVDKLNPSHWEFKSAVEAKQAAREIVWDLADALEPVLDQFVKDHPIRITKQLNFQDKTISLVIKPLPVKEEK